MKTTLFCLLLVLLNACSKQNCREVASVEPLQPSATSKGAKPVATFLQSIPSNKVLTNAISEVLNLFRVPT